MYKVKVQNACKCFFKSGLAETMDYETEEDAKKEAEKMIEKMRTTFCKKHEFSINEQFGDFTIYIKPRA